MPTSPAPLASSSPSPSPQDVTSLVGPVLSGLASGVVVAALNFLFTRRKTIAEVAKLELEAQKLRKELGEGQDALLGAVGHALTQSAESVVYSSAGRVLGHDFQGAEAAVWQNIAGKDQQIGDLGRGSVAFDSEGVLSVERTSTDGRYELWLQRYQFNGSELPHIPKNDTIEGMRSLRLSFEAKVVGGEHSLRFVFKNEKTGKWVAQASQQISSSSWTPHTTYFRVSPAEECRLRIDDIDVSRAPSSLQMRNIVLAEKLAFTARA